MEIFNSLDFSILDFIAENLKCAFLDFLMPVVTIFGDAGYFWIALAICLVITKEYRKAGVSMAVALILGTVVCNLLLKPLVARIRPYEINTAVELLVTKPSDYSFPSGHTTASFECATVLLLSKNCRRAGVAALILAVLIGFSRLYLYLHYPTDVIAGVLIGLLCGTLGYLAVDLICKKRGISR